MFTPRHPVTKPRLETMPDAERKLDVEALVAEAVVRGGGDGGDEFLVALVYPDPERFRELGLEQMRAQLSALADEVNDRLPYYKRLHHCEIREEPFPKNTSRKIVRYRV